MGNLLQKIPPGIGSPIQLVQLQTPKRSFDLQNSYKAVSYILQRNHVHSEMPTRGRGGVLAIGDASTAQAEGLLSPTHAAQASNRHRSMSPTSRGPPQLAKGGRVINNMQAGYSHSASPTAGGRRTQDSARSKPTLADHYGAAVYSARTDQSPGGGDYTQRSRPAPQRMSVGLSYDAEKSRGKIGELSKHTPYDEEEPPQPGSFSPTHTGGPWSPSNKLAALDGGFQSTGRSAATNLGAKSGKEGKVAPWEQQKPNQKGMTVGGGERYPDAPDLNLFLPLDRYEEIHPLDCVHNRGPNLLFSLDLEAEINFSQWGFRVGNPFIFKGSSMKDSLLITEIYQDGPLSEWNMQHISKCSLSEWNMQHISKFFAPK